ncbi:hypothetical protein H4R34_003784 [Dimargaris verticillata]|uniref:WD40-repeat-containing domain protein n=1 Tax=Dimargaris verticillata TaxID=2761393 RepID=A0A9W8B5G8_9FUNG|nr:hypothetical protein H4R34_003784 [Dimargaris verticillata]
MAHSPTMSSAADSFAAELPQPTFRWLDCLAASAPILVATTGNRYCARIADTLQAETLANQPRPQATGRGQEFNCFRAGHWSPDGAFILTSSHDQCARVFQLPETVLTGIQPAELAPFLTIREAEGIIDCRWYPFTNYYDPSTWCFLVSTRDHPMHLWDAYMGHVRCTYIAQDQREQVIAPTATQFNLDATKIYGGFHNHIQIFDIARPGKSMDVIPITPTRRSQQGQKGLVSAIEFNPDHSGLYAVATFANTVGLYSEKTNELLYLKKLPNGTGVTQAAASAISNRKHQQLYCWDIRNSGEFLYHLERPLYTNQRLVFDIDSAGETLVTGWQDGAVALHDLKQLQDHRGTASPVSTFKAHDGQHHLDLDVSALCSQSPSVDADSASGDHGSAHQAPDTSVRLWRWDNPIPQNESP